MCSLSTSHLYGFPNQWRGVFHTHRQGLGLCSKILGIYIRSYICDATFGYKTLEKKKEIGISGHYFVGGSIVQCCGAAAVFDSGWDYIPTTVLHGFWLMILTESSSKLLAYYEMEHGTFIILPVSIISLKKKIRKRGTCLGKEGLLRTPTIRIPYIFAICCVNTKQSSFNWFHAFTNLGMPVNQEFIPKIEFFRYNYDSGWYYSATIFS